MRTSTLQKAVLLGALVALLAAAILLTGKWFATRARRASSTHARARAELEIVAIWIEHRALLNHGVFERTLPSREWGRGGQEYSDVSIDLWGRPLLYAPPSNGLDGYVWTLGRDGLVGGVGDDEDLRHPVHASMSCGKAHAKDIEEE